MTTIGPGIHINGAITCDGDLTIDGGVTGQVLVRDGTLVIGQEARIVADLRGTRVRVVGEVQGNIAAGERIDLAATASVVGSLSASQVVIEEGAAFHGRIDMAQRTIAAKVAQFKAAQSA